MKTSVTQLQAVTGSTYDKTRTSMLGRTFQKTIMGDQAIGPALTGFIDTITTAGFAGSYVSYVPAHNLLFILQSATTASPVVMAYNFNNQTGAYSYLGRVTLNLPNSAATTYTYRGFLAWSNGTSVRLIFSISGSVAINSGVCVAYCNLAQFTVSGTNIFAASGAGQNAIYMLHSSDYYGVNAVTGFNNTTWGVCHPYLSGDSAINTKIYTLANTVAAPTAMVWDLATTPDVAGQIVNGVSSATAAIANTSPAAFFTSTTLPGYSGTNGEPVCLQVGTANVPTPFTAWPGGVAQTTSNVYFTRDVQRLFGFSCSPLATGISAGSTYQVALGSQLFTFTVANVVGAGATSFIASLSLPAQPTNPQAPAASGTLTRITGTGDASITYSSFTPGNFCFNLSATTGAAATTPTQTLAGFTMLRAFGTSINQFVARTPIAGFAPALAGTLLQTNVVNYARPLSVPANTALNNQDCLATATSSNLYLGRISDLIVLQTTGNTTAGSTSVTGMGSTTGLTAGMAVIGPAIPAGTTVASVGAGTITLSVGANSTTTGSALTFGTNNWSSFSTSNITGTGIDITAPTVAFSRYGARNLPNDVDRFAYVTGTSIVLKSLQNNAIQKFLGGSSIQWYEVVAPATVPTHLQTILGMEFASGWLFLSGGTAGQRGVVFADAWSDSSYGNSAIISAIQYVQPGTRFKYINSIEKLFDQTGSSYFWVRSASSQASSVFNTAQIPVPGSPGNWTLIETAEDLQGVALGPYFQLCVTHITLDVADQTPAQIVDLAYTYELPGEASDRWAPSVDNSTQSGTSPMFVAWRLQNTYASSVPTLYVRGYDDAGNVVASFDTVTNASDFSYSTNNGGSWTALGTIPNVAFTTEVRVNVATPPAVARINWSLSES